MRSAPSAPQPEHLPDVMDGLELSRRAWRMGWEDGYKQALKDTTVEQQTRWVEGHQDPW